MYVHADCDRGEWREIGRFLMLYTLDAYLVGFRIVRVQGEILPHEVESHTYLSAMSNKERNFISKQYRSGTSIYYILSLLHSGRLAEWTCTGRT